MNIYKTPYFRNNKRFIVLLGQWPFLSPIRRNCVRCIVLMAISSIFIPKFIKFIEVIHDIDGIIECIPMLGLHIASIIKYCNWIVNFKKMKHLLLHIQRDWNNLKFDRDIEIMREFYERGRVLTLAYAITMFSILGLYLASPSVPKILDVLYPLNESRARVYLYQTEYFVDEDEYYVAILIHAYMTVPISLSVIVFVDNMFAMYIHHACGLFTVLRLHLESIHISNNNMNDEESELKQSDEIYRNIVTSVNMHKNVIEFYKKLESSSTISYLLILMLNLSIITVNGIVTVMKLDKPNESVRFLAFTIGAIFHVFFSCFMGEKLIETSEVTFHAVYTFKWYSIPINFRPLVIPIMVRSIKPCQLTAGKVIVLSMDTFSLVLKNAMSLFTVVSSTR